MHGEIALNVTRTGDMVEMMVSDDGIGITADALPYVFEPFAHDVDASGANGRGLGIGLAIVRGLVEAHGGSVRASSPGAGQGSHFTVSLPLIPSMPASSVGATVH